MADKTYIIIAYALIGFGIAILSLLAKEKLILQSESPFFQAIKFSSEGSWKSFLLAKGIWKSLLFVLSAIIILAILHASISLPFISCFILIAAAISIKMQRFDIADILSGFIAICLSTTLLWWRSENGILKIHFLELLYFGLCTIVLSMIFLSEQFKQKSNAYIWMIPYVLLATILSFSVGIFNDNFALRMIVHHWGAFIGSAELLLTGAAIFNDFPTQYGLGPTALLASACGNDCWRGMYFVTGFTEVMYSVCIGILAFSLSPKSWFWRFTILCLGIMTCFFWTGWPAQLISPIMYPSLTGMRYLPVILLVIYLFFARQIETSTSKQFIAHGLWVFGALWSPESIFYVSFVWWPYYLFVRSIQGDIRMRIKNFFKSSLYLIMIAVSLLIVFNMVYWLIYHQFPVLNTFIVYALSPPTPLPLNTHGPILYFIFVLLLGIFTLIRVWLKSGDTQLFRWGFLIILLNYVSLAYFFGRSHDNTILTVMPFMLLTLLYAAFAQPGWHIRKMSMVLLATCIGWFPVFNWQVWQENIKNKRVLSFDAQFIRKTMQSADQQAFRYSDDTAAIAFLNRTIEPVTVLDYILEPVVYSNPKVWSAYHGPANILNLSSAQRREFIKKTAMHLKRSGWLLVDRWYKPADEILADFDTVYDRTEQREFDRFYAIHFKPKTGIQ